MSTLKSLYESEGADLLDRLHALTGANRKYLYQIAVGRRTPSAGLAKRLAAADPRMSLHELLFPGDAYPEQGAAAGEARHV